MPRGKNYQPIQSAANDNTYQPHPVARPALPAPRPAWLQALCTCSEVRQSADKTAVSARSPKPSPKASPRKSGMQRSKVAMKTAGVRMTELKKAAKSSECLGVTLMHACEMGRLWQIERCLANADKRRLIMNRPEGAERETPLMRFCSNAKMSEDSPSEVVRVLVQKYRADVHAVDSSGRSALMHALMAGSLDVAEELLHLRANINQPAKYSETALTWAVMSDDEHTCQWALTRLSSVYKSGLDPVNEEDGRGFTPLCHAAHGGELHSVRWLLNHAADINVAGIKCFHDAVSPRQKASPKGKTRRREQELTPLYLAGKEGYVEVMAHLLRRGAQLPKIAREDLHPDCERWICESGWQFAAFDTVENQFALFQKRGDFDDLISAIKGGDVQKVESVLSRDTFPVRNVVLSARNAEGQTPLLVAAKHNSGARLNQMMSELLESGALYNETDDSGQNAFMLAIHHSGGSDMLAGLADIQSRFMNIAHMEDSDGRSAPWFCFDGKKSQSLQKLKLVLTGEGSNDPTLKNVLSQDLLGQLEVSDCHGQRLLEVAVSHGNREVVQWLLQVWPVKKEELQTALSHRTLLGLTALLLAARMGELDICKDLVAARADVSATDPEGRDMKFYLETADSTAEARASALAWLRESRTGSTSKLETQRPAPLVVIEQPNQVEREDSSKTNMQPEKSQSRSGFKSLLARTRTLGKGLAEKPIFKKVAEKPIFKKAAGMLDRLRTKTFKTGSESQSAQLPMGAKGTGNTVTKDVSGESVGETGGCVKPSKEHSVSFGLVDAVENGKSCRDEKINGFEGSSPQEDKDKDCDSPASTGRRSTSDKKTTSPRRSSGHKAPRKNKRSPRRAKPRWECPKCGQPNPGDRETCSWCTSGPEESPKEVTVPIDGGELRFTVGVPPDSPSSRQDKAVLCYLDGVLESHVTRLHLHWYGKGLVEEFGYQYQDGVVSTERTKGSFEIPLEERDKIFTALNAMASETGTKVVSSGEHGESAATARALTKSLAGGD